jgi:putative ABC transport system permease protein
MLGVIIGVAAVIALVALGQGATDMVTAQIEQLGSNVVMVYPRSSTRLYLDDVAQLAARVPTLEVAIGSVSSNQVTAKWGNQTYATALEGTEPGYEAVRDHHVAGGRFLIADDVTNRRKVAVIGATVLDELFAGLDPLGEQILINGNSFTVIGVMESRGQGMLGNPDDTIYVPVTSAQRLLGTNRIGSITAKIRDGAEPAAVAAQITAIYQRKFPTVVNADGEQNDAVAVISQEQILSTVSGVTTILTTMLAGIAGVSLLVGGIGIMNIMLVSVTERTREIGIRKAIGARRREILLQFIVESVILSLLGGTTGILLGIGLGSLGRLFGLPASFSPGAMLLAFLFAASVGLIFGVYPAMRAANLDPIEALRHE